MSKLALLGGPKAVTSEPGDIFKWPIITPAIEQRVLEVLRRGAMSNIDVTKEFEKSYAAWFGLKYALGHNTGTAALQGAMFGLGLGHGDELICPSITYWASGLPALALGATIVFADIEPDTLCLDPRDFERRITRRSKAVVAVHYCGMPCDMDPILRIARRHKLAVIEDVSHAHGALYKGRLTGTFGDVACFSLMSGKPFAIGEGGILLTNNQNVYERAIVFGHYERHCDLTLPELKAGAGLPWGGHKYRMHQLSSAVGLEQVKNYPRQMLEIDRAMNYFWDLLEGVPGLRAHRPRKGSGSTMGGWYMAHGLYRGEELDGLSLSRFCAAVRAEGGLAGPGCNAALHLHPLLNSIDVYGAGRPTNLARGGAGRRKPEKLPVAEGIQERTFFAPWFKKFRPKIIAEHAAAYRKVAENYRDLLADDAKAKVQGSAGLFSRR
jgi:dTDP-4-amino-4,6-dideoxygalactose transaminase